MVLQYAKLAGLTMALALGTGMAVSQAHADTRFDTDYIALVVEAEDHSTRDERWVLTEPSTPAQENDPDGNHASQAVGQAYLELLPDMRVTHEDEFGPPTAIWNQPGTGPRAEYPLDFPEAGRYYVHIRAFSTGTEDNGIHVGLNGSFPQSGARMQHCTAGQGWAWSGRQRDSGGMGSCGAQKTIWVTVEEPGINTFMISAREDGYEIDRIMLIKDLSDNTRICKPSGADAINCVNGSLENVDDVVDMAVELERHDDESMVQSIDTPVSFSAVVRNRDGYDTARDVVLNLDLGLGTHWALLSVDEACEQQGESLSCALGSVTPSGPEGEQLFDVTVMPLIAGELSVGASVETSSIDGSQSNDEATLQISVVDEQALSALAASIVESPSAWVSDQETILAFTLSTTGPADADNVQARLILPSGVSVSTVPENCTGYSLLNCVVDTVAVDAPMTIAVGLTADRTGLFSVSLTATADNLPADIGTDAVDSVIVTVTSPDAQPAVDGTDTDSSDSGSLSIWLFMLLGLYGLSHAALVVNASRQQRCAALPQVDDHDHPSM